MVDAYPSEKEPMTEPSQSFTIFPAIDLRQGQVVRLRMGELSQQTTYSDDPSQIALRWLSAGARWLHVVNLDGAFGETDTANQKALLNILKTACRFQRRRPIRGRLALSGGHPGGFGAGREPGSARNSRLLNSRKLCWRRLQRWGPDILQPVWMPGMALCGCTAGRKPLHCRRSSWPKN